ncbi:CHRD domain-containing protein [Altererythrobacter fulvus]|uniref:CHRD domain-containing protein n=1 Tax=Caenibius fulvus TaxID=2126012 RepID=UPI003016EFD0
MIQPARTSALFLTAALLALPGCMAQTGAKPVKPYPGAEVTGLFDGRTAVPLGDPDGSGKFAGFVDLDYGRLCYTLSVAGIATPTAAHIHKGAPGAAGEAVLTLATPTYMQNQTCTPIDAALATDLIANPAAYYVNVHNAEFPGGAIRAQLEKGKGGK